MDTDALARWESGAAVASERRDRRADSLYPVVASDVWPSWGVAIAYSKLQLTHCQTAPWRLLCGL